MKNASAIASFAVFLASVAAARTGAAANVCNETVPTNRFIDGLPAYQQCTDSNNASIWTNNGIDTATASGGAGWVKTQFGGGYQCTEWAHRYMLFRWNIDYEHGDAKDWCDGTLPSTLVKSTTPVHGDLIVFGPNACGADATTGHIAVVDSADSSKVTFVEENSASRRSCALSTATCFLHATANDGTPADAGAGDASNPKDAGGNGGSTGAGGTSGTGAGGANTGGTSGTGVGGTSGTGAGGTSGTGAGGTIGTGAGGTSGTGAGGTFGTSTGAGGAAGRSTGAGGSDHGGSTGAGAQGGASDAGVPGHHPPPDNQGECSCRLGNQGANGTGAAGVFAIAMAALASAWRRGRRTSRRC